MRSILVLARHGNTFEPNQPATMVGSAQDLPLTSEGRAQAARFGAVFAPLYFEVIQAAPLKRTMEFADIVRASTGSESVVAEPRLTELDYGDWSGATSDEIRSRGSSDELERWDTDGVWPVLTKFSPPEAQVTMETRDLLHEAAQRGGRMLLVTSNGRLKMFGRELGVPERPLKVRTGSGVVAVFEGGGWTVKGWNLEPSRIAGICRSL